MRTVVVALVGFLSLVPLAPASANGVYIGSEVGMAYVPSITFSARADRWRRDPSFGAAAAGQVGYAMRSMRAEAEIGFARSGGDLRLGDAMLNVYYDVARGGRLTPFLGLGGGVARVTEQKAVDVAAATQAIAGASFDLTKRLSLKADYRYFRTLEETFNLPWGSGSRPARATPEAHCLMLGVTFRFGGKWQKP